MWDPCAEGGKAAASWQYQSPRPGCGTAWDHLGQLGTGCVGLSVLLLTRASGSATISKPAELTNTDGKTGKTYQESSSGLQVCRCF